MKRHESTHTTQSCVSNNVLTEIMLLSTDSAVFIPSVGSKSTWCLASTETIRLIRNGGRGCGVGRGYGGGDDVMTILSVSSSLLLNVHGREMAC